MRIVSLKCHKPKKDLYRLELDDGSALELDAEVALNFNLRNGAELDAEQLERMRRQDAYVRGRKRAAGYCSVELKPSGSVRRYLMKRGLDGESIERIISYLEERKYIDDREFGRRFVESRMKRRPCGALKLAADLKGKGLADELVEELVAPYRDYEVQLEAARRCLEKRKRRIVKDGEKARQRALSALRGQGFDGEVCRAALEEFVGLVGSD